MDTRQAHSQRSGFAPPSAAGISIAFARLVPLIFVCAAATASTSFAQKRFPADDESGAGRCDVASLNARPLAQSGQGQVFVSNSLPSYCLAYTNHTYADLNASLPMYVGSPDRGGRWVEPKDYAKALAAFNARIATENAVARQFGGSGN